MLNALSIRNPAADLFEDGFFSDFFRPVTAAARAWSPAVDIAEHEDKLVLHADLPGVDEKDVKVEVREGQLVLEASRSSDAAGGKRYLLRERGIAAFRRTFDLGDSIDAEKIEASFKNGTLALTLPKSQRAKPKVIPISVR
jgi:HSP20 family protein